MKDFAEKNLLRLNKISQSILSPTSIYGYYPCNSFGDYLHVYKIRNNEEMLNLYNLETEFKIKLTRQKKIPYQSVADFFRNQKNGISDICAFQLVSLGSEAVSFANKLQEGGKFQDYFLWNGYCSALTEAYAGFVHSQIRQDLKIGKSASVKNTTDSPNNYQGIRYSFGYKCCPNLSIQRQVLKLLHAEKINVEMNIANQLVPEFSTCALIAHHPQARYFDL